ncbi:MAG: chromosomal replication initiator protein DnaA [Candidatus Latescibacteria bacterium]|nr:chromosomal replication initiator protein DnaA [Candidatus Latescibacterota bacterium]NIM22663.1 chromosomal replication initiator protein DnaA [Candidatus Latescibacterota bacterium]NIM64952.1 chromosomal replication initiator protein DnaA [Candidatus Latescibacterota bacterium]NIO01467.1 chromosomal replication initiator protein DnaA [Candidatus Latescibacterota bacterium]NIO27977.1 chromosomal replication initiator protein DnaA [Candidatus Latescibacterota bacterium]
MPVSPQHEDKDQIWSQFLAQVSTLVNKQTMVTWFNQMSLRSIADSDVVIECPSKFFMDWVSEHHRDRICYALRKVLKFEPKLHFVNTNGSTADSAWKRGPLPAKSIPESSPVIMSKKIVSGGEPLNSKYTFDEFVVGKNSQMAYAACLAVSDKPAIVYNPLFIYGGVGLGKTHLMQAIGHTILEQRTNLKVHYSSAETFMNELISTIREGKSHKFREKYRNVDILLIDDVHFLAGKESTQEEFFHTFNALHGSSKQIVVTSDRPPKEIPTLEERLVSRFEWGLITDIQSPDYETRLAILRKKVDKEQQVEIPNDVLELIANSVKSNIRELEGSLVKLFVHASVYKKDITLEVAQEVLKDFVKHSPRKVSISTIQKVVAQHFRVPVEAMKSKVRTARYAYPRQVAIYLSRQLTNCSLTQIGQRFGGRDHTTVIHACQKISELAERDVSLKATLQQLRKELT